MMDKLRYFVNQLDGDERTVFSYILDAAEASHDSDAADLLQAMKVLARFRAEKAYKMIYVKIYDEAHEIMGVSA